MVYWYNHYILNLSVDNPKSKTNEILKKDKITFDDINL